MVDTTPVESGRSSARSIPVWDPIVRLVHWSVALGVLANSFTDGDQPLHHWIGYAALALVAIRLVWGLVGSDLARFRTFPPSPRRALAHLRDLRMGRRVVHLSHNPLGALMVYNLWGSLLVIGISGYMMTTYRFFGVNWVGELHELAYSWLLLSIGLHIGGVVYDTVRTKVSLVGAMVTGRKILPDGLEIE